MTNLVYSSTLFIDINILLNNVLFLTLVAYANIFACLSCSWFRTL